MKCLYAYYSHTRKAWIYRASSNELSMIAFARRNGDIIKSIDVVRCLFKLS